MTYLFLTSCMLARAYTRSKLHTSMLHCRNAHSAPVADPSFHVIHVSATSPLTKTDWERARSASARIRSHIGCKRPITIITSAMRARKTYSIRRPLKTATAARSKLSITSSSSPSQESPGASCPRASCPRASGPRACCLRQTSSGPGRTRIAFSC